MIRPISPKWIIDGTWGKFSRYLDLDGNIIKITFNVKHLSVRIEVNSKWKCSFTKYSNIPKDEFNFFIELFVMSGVCWDKYYEFDIIPRKNARNCAIVLLWLRKRRIILFDRFIVQKICIIIQSEWLR